MRNPADEHALADSLQLLISATANAGEEELAHLLAGSTDAVESIASDFVRMNEDRLTRDSDGLPLPVLVRLLTAVDTIGEALGQTDLCVYHDETRQFAPVLEHMISMVRDASEVRFFLANGTQFRMGYSSVSDLAFVGSESSSLIQAADVLAATLGSQARQPSLLGDDDSRASLAFKHVAFMAWMETPTECSLMGSGNFLTQLMAPVLKHWKQHSNQT